MALRAELAPGVVEKAAWKLTTSSRRFFSTLAVVVVGVVLSTSLFTAWVASRNAAAVAAAREQGEEVATAIADFRDHLGQANDEVAETLVADAQEPSSLGRSQHEAQLQASSLALTRAGLSATGKNGRRIELLAQDLELFATLVATSHAYPVGTRYHRDARAMVRDRLVPRADRTRASAERQIAGAADEVAGARTALAIAGTALAIVTTAAGVVLVAGRTRIRLHPAFVVAIGLLVVQLVVVATGLWTERDELQEAAGEDFSAYSEADNAAAAIYDLRSVETDATAGLGDTEELDAEFDDRADDLVPDGGVATRAATDPATLSARVAAYAESVEDVRSFDESAAVEATVDGQTAFAYQSARALAIALVASATTDLSARLDAADDAGLAWPVPLLLGAAATVFAVGGIRRRGQEYMWRPV